MRVFHEIDLEDEVFYVGFEFSGDTERVSEGNSEFSREYDEFTVTDIDFDNIILESDIERNNTSKARIESYIKQNKQELKEALEAQIYETEAWRE